MRLVVETQTADVNRRGTLEEAFVFGVTVEAADGAQPPTDGGASAAAVLEIAGVALDVRAPYREQTQAVLLAPGDELTQVQGVDVSRQPR